MTSAEQAGSPQSGPLLAGRYRLTSLIAAGGMGEVWAGTDVTMARPVAVKVLKAENVEQPTYLARFRSEARLAAAVSHPGIAEVYDYGEQPARGPGERPLAFLVMELVEGQPLSALLAGGRRLPPEQVLDLMAQTAEALQVAHSHGVVHRDVKPGNLLVTGSGQVKVTDFGVARAAGSSTLTEAGTVLGTVYYLSPEQSTGAPATPLSDVYALGVVGYEALAGRRPFVGSDPVTVARAALQQHPPPLPADVPDPVASLVMQAMARDPRDRPVSAGALAATARAVSEALFREAPHPDPRPVAAGAPSTPVTARRAGSAASAPRRAAGPLRSSERTPGGGSRGRRLRAPAAGLALLVLLLAVALLRHHGSDHHAGAAVRMPSLLGAPLTRARVQLRAEHLLATVHRAPSELGAGLVVATSPVAGARLREGTTVLLVVSSGPAAHSQAASASALPRVISTTTAHREGGGSGD